MSRGNAGGVAACSHQYSSRNSHTSFHRTSASAVFQDQSEWQIERQSRAREGLSRACECSRLLVFFLVNPPYLR
jgi:hypothetical protein